jgi:hypothetical protein
VFAGSVDTNRVIGIPVIVPINQTFSMGLSLEAQTEAFKDSFLFPVPPGAVSASSDYFHTLSFLSGSPVLTLPSGYTFNSVEAGITNNQWGNSAPVPEPASAMLFGVGLLCVARRARRRI